MPPVPWLDTACFRALNAGVANGVLDVLFPFLTTLHQRPWFIAMLACAAATAMWKGGTRARLCVPLLLAAVALSDTVCSRAIKPYLPRERPCQAIAHGDPPPAQFTVRVPNPEGCPGSRSFPSNHAANTGAVAAVAWYLTRRRSRWLWALLPAVVAWTRVYLGYHYPSDVLAGWLVGILAASTVLMAVRLAFPQSSTLFAGSAGTAV